MLNRREKIRTGKYALIGALLTVGFMPGQASARDWVNFGCLDIRGDKRNINVGRDMGAFDSVRVSIKGGTTIEMNRLDVVYGNGSKDKIIVDEIMSPNSRSSAYDLKGDSRFISHIGIRAQKASSKKRMGVRRAIVCLAGRRDARRAQVDRFERDAERRVVTRGGWSELGCFDVRNRNRMSTVRIGRNEGRFTAIRLAAERRNVNIDDLRVVYGNNRSERLNVRDLMRAGSETRSIDLKGNGRFLKRIEVTSQKTRNARRGAGQLCVFGMRENGRPAARFKPRGRPAPAPRPRGNHWETLGCKKVAFMADHDTIRVGRREGRFRAIRLDVEDVSVQVSQVKVNYANGKPDYLPFSGKVTRGTSSPPLDLIGRRRSIHSVEVVQRAKLNLGKLNFLKGGATVCVSGLR